MRLRYLYCKRHIGFFQQLFRGPEKFIEELGIRIKINLSQSPVSNFISPYLIVELFGKLYPRLIKKVQSQLPPAAFL